MTTPFAARLAAALLLLVPCLALPADLASRPVSVVTGPDAAQPSVAWDAREGFVLTWQERDGETASLWFAVLDRDGRERRRGRIAAGTGWFVNGADFPSLAVLDGGDWVTYWLQHTTDAPYAYEIRVVRSTDRGRTWSAPVAPHADHSPAQHGFVTLAPAGGDRVLVAWLDGRAGADHGGHDEDGPMTLRAATLDRRGRVGDDVQLDDSTCSCCQTDSARLAGRTMVAYRDRTAAEVRDIATVEQAADGSWSAPRIVNPDGFRIEGCPVNGPALAASGGALITAWPTLAGESFEVRYVVRRGADAGADAGAGADARAGAGVVGGTGGTGAKALAGGPGTLGRVDAAAAPGGFLVTWVTAKGDGAGVQVARIDAAGDVTARRTLAGLAKPRAAGHPRIASAGDRALIAWTAPGAGGRGTRLQLALLSLAGAR